jgi:hypothetical protein
MKEPKHWPIYAFVLTAIFAILMLSGCGSQKSSSSPEPADGPEVVTVPVDPPEALVKKIILNWLEQHGAQQNEEVGAWTVEKPLPLYCFPREG